MNTVIFARGKNVREQVERCKAYAEERGYQVNGVIVGGSHEITDTIKALQESIKIELVLVSCMSRISRNALEGYTIQADLELDCGVLVQVADDKPRDEAMEKFMRKIIAAVNQEQRRERERTQKIYELKLRGLID